MTHRYYQFSEYEAQLIAARWIDPGSVDPDYQAYLMALKRNPYLDQMDYAEWQDKRREWDLLDSECSHIESTSPNLINGPRWMYLLDRMTEIEICLGY